MIDSMILNLKSMELDYLKNATMLKHLVVVVAVYFASISSLILLNPPTIVDQLLYYLKIIFINYVNKFARKSQYK